MSYLGCWSAARSREDTKQALGRMDSDGFVKLPGPCKDARPSGRYIDSFWVRTKTWFFADVSVTTDRKDRLSRVRNMTVRSVPRKMAPSHSHASAANARADATTFLTSVAKALGKRRYDVSISPREARMGSAGSRHLRVTKDLLTDSRSEKLLEGDFVTMVDTDYYMSEQQISQFAGHDFGLYALQPDSLAKSSKDSSWSFVDSRTVVEEVSGGAVYRHEVWDWGKDLLVLGRWGRTYIYDVVLFQLGMSRVVVVCLLARTIHLPVWLTGLLYPDMAEYRLARMQIQEDGQFLVGVFGTPGDRRVHIKASSLLGEDAVRIKLNTYRVLAVAGRIPNTDKKVPTMEVLPSTVERHAKSAGEKLPPHGAHVLSSYFSTKYRPLQMVNYQAGGDAELDDGKATAAIAAVPIVGAGCAPVSSEANEVRAVKARIDDVANAKLFPADMILYAGEFARHVIPARHVGKGVPLELAELRSLQSRPLQRARRLQEEPFLPRGGALTTKSFQKNETYSKPSDPRLVNQVPTDHTNRLCAYSAGIKPVLKDVCGRWYMVGKSPMEIALGLKGLQRSVGGELEGGDYSRMDGRTSISNRRHVLEPVYLRYYAPEYHAEIIELLAKEERAKTVTAGHGVRAALNGANISGSGVTTDLNTLDAAFNEYAARRRMGEDAAKAYRALGCYFGDDSVLDARVFPKVEEVASQIGMVLTRETKPKGAPAGYVVFLSRVYPDISTSLASHPCIVRAMRKLCTIVVPSRTLNPNPGAPVKDLEVYVKLRLKVEGVLRSDPNTPLVSQYAQALKRVYGLDRLRMTEKEWKAMLQDKSFAALTAMGPYPNKPEDGQLLLSSVAQELQVGPEELQLLLARLDAAQTESDLVGCSLPTELPKLPDWARWVPTRAI